MVQWNGTEAVPYGYIFSVCDIGHDPALQKTDEPLWFVRFVWEYYRCRTRSLISWVRPWFQYWVPM